MAVGELPPDLCVEIALWDRFGWGPSDTDLLPLWKLKLLFKILDQQRATKDAVENLGAPSYERMSAKQAAAAQQQNRKSIGSNSGSAMAMARGTSEY